MSRDRKRSIGGKILCPLTLALLSTAACPPAPVWGEAVAASLPSPVGDEAQSPWSIQLGALLIDWTTYDGADEYETIAFPLFTIEYGERYFADAIDGIGVHLPTKGPVTLDVSLTADLGRAESDSTRLAGLGDIDAGIALKLKAGHEHGAFSYGASIERTLSDDETGFQIDLEAGYTRVLGGTLVLTPALVARYGSADYMQRYYGVDDAQSARSGLDAYFPEQGLASAGAQLTALKLLRGGWIVQGQIKSERILGNAADSPIVFEENPSTIAVGFVHTLR